MSTLLNHQIPDFEYPIPANFIDSSYGNDSCASITSELLNLQVFIDAKEPSNRENKELARFCVINASEYGEGNSLLESNNFDDVLTLIEQRKESWYSSVK